MAMTKEQFLLLGALERRGDLPRRKLATHRRPEARPRYLAALRDLARASLVRIVYSPRGGELYRITPAGRAALHDVAPPD